MAFITGRERLRLPIIFFLHQMKSDAMRVHVEQYLDKHSVTAI